MFVSVIYSQNVLVRWRTGWLRSGEGWCHSQCPTLWWQLGLVWTLSTATWSNSPATTIDIFTLPNCGRTPIIQTTFILTAYRKERPKTTVGLIRIDVKEGKRQKPWSQQSPKSLSRSFSYPRFSKWRKNHAHLLRSSTKCKPSVIAT